MGKAREKVFCFLILTSINSFLPKLIFSGNAMRTVVSTVCNNWYSGTDHQVRLFFKSIKKTPGKEDKVNECRTEILDTGVTGSYENDWATGGTQTWGYKEQS